MKRKIHRYDNHRFIFCNTKNDSSASFQKSLTKIRHRHIDTHGGFCRNGIEYTCITYDEAEASVIKSIIQNERRFSPMPATDVLLSSCDSAVASEKDVPLPSSVHSAGWYSYLDRSPAKSEHLSNSTLFLYEDESRTPHIRRADS